MFVMSVVMNSHQNKAEKPTIKQSMKVLNINVIAAIIKQDWKSHKNTQSELPIVNQTQNKFNQCEDENTYLSKIKFDLDLVA